jgi:nicotinamidase-related amidase
MVQAWGCRRKAPSHLTETEEDKMEFQPGNTAVVITDPQNDFLSPEGVTWELVGNSVTENNTVEHLEQLIRSAKAAGYTVFVSPHYYYPTDSGWQFGGAVENLMHEIHMFDRSGPLSLEGFKGSGADWVEPLGKYLEDAETVVVSPHKVYGPETNDLARQLRKRGVDKVILAGMSATLCVEAHLRQLTEDGFEVYVVKDATAGAKGPEGDGYGRAHQLPLHGERGVDHQRGGRTHYQQLEVLGRLREVPTRAPRAAPPAARVGKEGILSADIDPRLAIEDRQAVDCRGRYARRTLGTERSMIEAETEPLSEKAKNRVTG